SGTSAIANADHTSVVINRSTAERRFSTTSAQAGSATAYTAALTTANAISPQPRVSASSAPAAVATGAVSSGAQRGSFGARNDTSPRGTAEPRAARRSPDPPGPPGAGPTAAGSVASGPVVSGPV